MITVYCIGKVKIKYVKAGVEEFLKRLQKYERVQYVEAKDFKNLKGYVVALEETGKGFTSQKFAQKVNNLVINEKDVTFLIGGPEGIPDSVPRNEDMSLSYMTFPNELVRVIFLEQLYRAFTIIKNEPYHR